MFLATRFAVVDWRRRKDPHSEMVALRHYPRAIHLESSRVDEGSVARQLLGHLVGKSTGSTGGYHARLRTRWRQYCLASKQQSNRSANCDLDSTNISSITLMSRGRSPPFVDCPIKATVSGFSSFSKSRGTLLSDLGGSPCFISSSGRTSFYVAAMIELRRVMIIIVLPTCSLFLCTSSIFETLFREL
ncbi:hypothetical protein AcW1_005764 [Taiwanofungus camphoratus]|nr:hypothetical protein AcW2_004526 [Antrodia cinnamomea]KAI0934149.1 hypothetical protein AcV5_006089 [Antrodia cinnamomea]KAI0950556.1 hypothetical protein AcV7_008983 [Antrodia cinnamomea]KAI0957345.1 hypothetical protein AcW1_005764 [Antrodia cinnamomea]